MTSHRPAWGGFSPVFPLIVGLVRTPGGRRNAGLGVGILVFVVVGLVIMGVMRARHVAEFAPDSVVNSREPLQELPIRVASGSEAVEPAHTYDAIIDVSSIDAIVVGVDLDYVLKGMSHYEVVIRTQDGHERFRQRIPERAFQEGRLMLRLFSKRFARGDYVLDIEGFNEGASDGRIIASSWFQLLR